MKVKKKILILGSSGNLGSALYERFKKDFIVSHNGLIKKKLDITNVKNLEKLIKKNNPNIIINAAGYVNLDLCEKYKNKCLKINAEIIKKIFLVKKKINQNFKILHFSTDQLYDGNPFYKTEKHKVKINNFYSKTKHLSEQIALKYNSTVFRINFFGLNKNKSGPLDIFIKNSIKNGKCILFDDVYFNPLRIKTLVNIIHVIIKRNKLSSGLFNLGSRDGLSKKDFYVLIFKYLKKNINYKSIKVNSYLNTKRSKNMLMSVKKFEKKYKIKLPLIKNEIKKEIVENYESIKNR